MKKYVLSFTVALLLTLTGLLLLSGGMVLDWKVPDMLPHSQKSNVEKAIIRVASLLADTGISATDAREMLLTEAGIPVLDTDDVYPEYLTNSQALRDFWEKVDAGANASFSCCRILPEGGFRLLFFWQEEESNWFCSSDVILSGENRAQVVSSEVMPVLEMTLADWDIFYYRLYPAGDPHYIDYSQIHLYPVDREKYDLTRTYILPVGYQMVNLFLVDWQEGELGSLSFTDLLESFYLRDTGEDFPWETYLQGQIQRVVNVPAAIMEGVVLPYFSMELSDFRNLCQYDTATDTYPWWPVHGDDLTAWDYPMCEPLVTQWRDNADGTLTLTVRVGSPDLKTDCLFSHEVTVRPITEDTFQYVRNRVTYVSDRGLPPAQSRSQIHRVTPFRRR